MAKTDQNRNLGGRPCEEGNEKREQFPLRLSPSDRRRVEEIQEHEGLSSAADAVRHSIRETHESLEEFPG